MTGNSILLQGCTLAGAGGDESGETDLSAGTHRHRNRDHHLYLDTVMGSISALSYYNLMDIIYGYNIIYMDTS